MPCIGGIGGIMKKLAALTGAIALIGALGACSSSASSSTAAAASKSAAPKPAIETMTGKVTGAAAVANTTVIPLKLTGVVNTTGTFTVPSGNATHATVTFPTKAGNFVVAAVVLNPNATPTVVNAAACRFIYTGHVTYTVDGSKSTGTFAGATGSGKATLVFEADAPKYTSGSDKGKCNMSNNAQPMAAGALTTFAAAGPLKLK
jgi:hypothetical protein